MVIEKIVVPGRIAAESRYAQRKHLGEHQASSEDAVVFEHDNNQKEQQHGKEKEAQQDLESSEDVLLREDTKSGKNLIHVVV